jgi:formate transporter
LKFIASNIRANAPKQEAVLMENNLNGLNGNTTISMDPLLPADMAEKASDIGIKKTKLGFSKLFGLSVLAGAFIALGAIFATIALSGVVGTDIPWGWSRIVAGLAFTLGLVLVVVGGAELFTGNNLIVMAWAEHHISTKQVLRNWIIVYVGNFVGSIGTALFVFLGQMYLFNNGVVGATALNIALSKVHLGFVQAICLGMLCNGLVCLAVWLTFSARSTIDKIASIILPVSAFVAAGFEHCVANMYFIPFALFVKSGAPDSFWTAIGKSPADYASLTWGSFLWNNLLPVTIGNIIGGAVLVGAVYWLIYLKK